MTREEDQKWIETNNTTCAMLRQLHDSIALSSLPPKRKWVGLTDEDLDFWGGELGLGELGKGVLRAVDAHLKEKNGG